jgi:hypothetical protein|tara:strand:- start:87 stop:401 length:315 start_codon:yes stop_codon:yes gene_type:complete
VQFLHPKEIQAGSLQAAALAGLCILEAHQQVVQVLEEVLLVEHLVQVIHLRRRQIQAVVQVEVLLVMVMVVLEVQALFVLRYLQQIIQEQQLVRQGLERMDHIH